MNSVTVSSTPARDDTYGLGEEIHVVVSFDKPVNVTGSPTLALETGHVPSSRSGQGVKPVRRTATKVSMSSRQLVFSYRARFDDLDTDGISIENNTLLGSGIKGYRHFL